jgi:hypothetical protein
MTRPNPSGELSTTNSMGIDCAHSELSFGSISRRPDGNSALTTNVSENSEDIRRNSALILKADQPKTLSKHGLLPGWV